MKFLFYRLIIFLDSTNESDTNYNIALYLANNITQISEMGISELAKACFVSPATISRFCRALGYDNYAHLKQECLSFQTTKAKAKNLCEIPNDMIDKDPTHATIYYTQKVARQMLDLPKYLDWKVIDRILQMIHDTEKVYFFGTQFSHSAAMHLQTDLMMLDKFTMAYMDVERQEECAKELSSDDLVIIVSVNGNFINTASKTLKYLERSKAKTVLITQNKNSAMIQIANEVLLFGNGEDPKVAKHSLLTVVELMAKRYFSLYSK